MNTEELNKKYNILDSLPNDKDTVLKNRDIIKY